MLDVLGERVLYMDTDSIIFMDDGTVEYEKLDLVDNLGQCPKGLSAFVTVGPKSYAYRSGDKDTVSSKVSSWLYQLGEGESGDVGCVIGCLKGPGVCSWIPIRRTIVVQCPLPTLKTK